MIVRAKHEVLKKINFFRGLNDQELSEISALCEEDFFTTGEICQKEGEPVSRIYFIVNGKVGVEFHMNSIAYGNKDIIMYTLNDGDVIGWSALIEGVPWSTSRAINPTEVLYLNADDLKQLCARNTHIGYILMKQLASLIASRLRRSRMTMLNSIVAIKSEW